MFDMKKTGEKIVLLRTSLGITQSDIANSLGVSYQAVSSWERGVSMPDISNLPKLAEILGTTIDCLLNAEEPLKAVSSEKSSSKEGSPEEFNMAKILYDSGNLGRFCDAVESFSSATLSKIFKVAYKDGNFEFVSEMVELVTQNDLKDCALYAYENNDIRVFSETAECLNGENKMMFEKMALKDGRSDFLAELFE